MIEVLILLLNFIGMSSLWLFNINS